MVDTGAFGPMAGQNPGLSSRRRRGRGGGPNPGGPRQGGRGQSEHATIDLSGARQGMIDTELPYDTSHAAGVYSTGGGPATTYDPHYHREETYQYAVAQREDMQVANPEAANRSDVRGPGQ